MFDGGDGDMGPYPNDDKSGQTGPNGPDGQHGQTGPNAPDGNMGPYPHDDQSGQTGPNAPDGQRGQTGPNAPDGNMGPYPHDDQSGQTGPNSPDGDIGHPGTTGTADPPDNLNVRDNTLPQAEGSGAISDDPCIVIEKLAYSFDQIRQMQDEDAKIKTLIARKEAKLNSKGVYTTFGVRWPKELLLIPQVLAVELTSFLHIRLAHIGGERLHDVMKRAYHFMGMRAATLDVAKRCKACIKSKGSPALKHPEPPKPEKAIGPWQRIYTDLCDFGRHDILGHRYFIGICDDFSHYNDGMPLKDKKAETVAAALVELLLRNNAVNAHLVSDNGLEFVADKTQKALELLGIYNTRISPYHPCGNRQERTWRELRVQAKIREMPLDTWSRDVHLILFQINHSTSKGLGGLTPAEVLTGKPLCLPSVPPLPPVQAGSHSDWMCYIQDWLHTIGEQMRQMQEEQYEQKRQPKSQRTIELQIGDRVAIWNPLRAGQSKKLHRSFDMEGEICEILGQGAYRIKIGESSLKRNIEHIRKL